MGKDYITIPAEVIEILQTLPIQSTALYIGLLSLDTDVDYSIDDTIEWITGTFKAEKSMIIEKASIEKWKPFNSAWINLLSSGLIIENKDGTITLTKYSKIKRFLTSMETDIRNLLHRL